MRELAMVLLILEAVVLCLYVEQIPAFFGDDSKNFPSFATSSEQSLLEENVWPSIYDCLCQVSGSLGDCSCDVESVDSYNSRLIYPQIRELTYRDYFKYFKVNLLRECSFWADDGRCVLRDCAVEPCPDENLPPELLKQHVTGIEKQQSGNHQISDSQPEKNRQLDLSGYDDSDASIPEPGCGNSEEQRESKVNAEALGSLDGTITDNMREQFQVWEEYDSSNDQNFCVLERESDPDAFYVDLTLNPERYTGYKGRSANRIWSSIYNENCFNPKDFGMNVDFPDDTQPFPNKYSKKKEGRDFTHLVGSYSKSSSCLEKRVFYRLISGLHASISVHLSAKYLMKDIFGEMTFGPYLPEFRNRFDPGRTNNEGPQRLKNIYFIYLVEMKAILKAKKFLENLQFFTNIDNNDSETKRLVKLLLSSIQQFPHHFDEKVLFREKEVQSLKEVYKTQFRNISRIMDCVGCDKCKLWGKVQVQGLGTALKILFSQSVDEPKSSLNLSRTEVVALFNAFAQLSESIWHIQEFRDTSKEHSPLGRTSESNSQHSEL